MPKKPKETKPHSVLEHDPSTPIDVTYEGDSVHAKATKNGDAYIHTLKLTSPCTFALVKTVSSISIPAFLTTQKCTKSDLLTLLLLLRTDCPQRG